MSVIEWYQELSGTEVLTMLSSNVSSSENMNNQLLVLYVILSVIIKRPSLLLAFLLSFLLFELSLFDPVTEVSLYMLTFIIYSFVICCKGLTQRNKVACSFMLLVCIVLIYDSFFYGANGYYGARKTFVYNNIEYISLCAHIILIISFVNISRVRCNIRGVLGSILRVSRNSVGFVVM